MRMKDSDDYITARAANPRTGLVSPSVGTRTPCTPSSPGAALAMKQHLVDRSPAKMRPPLTKANDGRKMSNSSRGSPCGVNQLVGLNESHDDRRSEDQFVIHMPSAREPQPFAYPGYTPEQIDAYEHYRRKARHMSSEGYDRRLFPRQPSCCPCTSPIGFGAYSTDVSHTLCSPSAQCRRFTAYNGHPSPEPPTLTVRKRRMAPDDSRASARDHDRHGTPVPTTVPILSQSVDPFPSDDHHDSSASPPVATTTTAQLQAPAPPPSAQPHAEPGPAVLKLANRALSRNNLNRPKPIVRSAPRLSGSAPDDPHLLDFHHHHPAAHPSPRVSTPDLTLLPRVDLVRPEHAALPGARRRITTTTRIGSRASGASRHCSLGCRGEGVNGACVAKRTPSAATVVRPLLDDDDDHNHDDAFAFFADAVMSLLQYLGSLQWPTASVLATLRDPHVSLREKSEALRPALSLAGHVLAACTVLAMVWKFAAAVVLLLESVTWPLVVPLRFLAWVLVG